MNKTYIVVREGVYQQGVVGVTKDLCIAKDIATEAIQKERDDYHDFHIYSLENDCFNEEEKVVAKLVKNIVYAPLKSGQKKRDVIRTELKWTMYD